jgi:hypothetical protein
VGSYDASQKCKHDDVFHWYGALVFYLISRFEVTGETFDVATNKSWFNIKLIISVTHEKTLNK